MYRLARRDRSAAVFDGGSTTLRLSRWVPGTAPRAVDPRGAPWGANWCGRTNGLLVVALGVLVVVLAPAADGRLTTKPDSANVATSNRDRLTTIDRWHHPPIPLTRPRAQEKLRSIPVKFLVTGTKRPRNFLEVTPCSRVGHPRVIR